MPAFNQFKLRYSYGVTGVSPSFSDQYEAMTNDGTGAIRRSNLGNVNITPTFTKEQEIGIDLAYKSRLSATVTSVRNDSKDVFVNVPAPAVSTTRSTPWPEVSLRAVLPHSASSR